VAWRDEKLFATDHLTRDLKGRSVRGGVVSMLNQGMKLVLQLVQLTVLARLLTPEDYGIWGMALVVTGFLALFQDLGLSMATVQKREITREQVNALFWVNAGLGAAIGLVACALAPAVAWWNDAPALVPVILTMGTAFLLNGLAVQHVALLRRQMRFGRIAVLELGALLGGTAVGIACAWAGLAYWSLVWMQIASALLTVTGAWVLCPWVPGRPRRAAILSMLGFGAHLLGANVRGWLGRSVDILLLGWRWGQASVGFYERSTRLMLLPVTQVNAPVTHVAIPALSRVAHEPERYRAAYLRLVDKVLLVTLPGVAVLVATSDWIVAVLMGPQWDEAAEIFAILGLGALVQSLVHTFGWLFISQDRTDEMLRLGAIDTVARIAAVALGLPWGARGVAIGITLRAFALLPVYLWAAGRRGPVSVRHLVRPVAAPFAAAASVFAVVFSVRGATEFASPAAGLAITVPLAAVAALVVLVLLPASRTALLDIHNAVKSVRRRDHSTRQGRETVREAAGDRAGACR